MPGETDGTGLPPREPARTTIGQRAEMIVPADQGAIMIPESAFKQALEDTNLTEDAPPDSEGPGVVSSISRFLSLISRSLLSLGPVEDRAVRTSGAFAVDEATALRAAELAGTANEQGTLGVLGDLRDPGTQQPFSGNLFIVVRDELGDRDSGRVESMDYDVAAVELSGVSPWIGTEVRFAVGSGMAGQKGRCCGPPKICIPNDPSPVPCDLGAFCPSERVGVTSVEPSPLEDRRMAGEKVVNLTVFTPDRFAGPRPGGSGILPLNYSCVTVLDKLCTQVKPVCDAVDIGFTSDSSGSGRWGSGSNPCGVGGSSSSGRDVPPICTVISGWENLPAECGGWCEGCGHESYYARHNLPPWCAMMTPGPGSDICMPLTPGKQLLDNLAMQQKAGWTSGSHQGASVCEPTGRGGMEICTECDAEGNCHQRLERPLVDPTLANDPDDEKTPIVEEPKREHDDFEPDWIDVPPPKKPNEPPPKVEPEPGPQPPPPPPKEPTFRERMQNMGLAPTDLVAHGPGPRQDENTQNTKGDPIGLGDGSFYIQHTDLSFEGPAGPFEFKRTYNSRSHSRSALGSNWLHNWNVRLQPLTEDTTPAWASPYCAGSPDTQTCLLMHEGDGNVEMFFLDLQTRLFMPQAGSTDTIASTSDGGWALRTSDGQVRYFNEHGYLINERDRFGNGFSIEYEATPLFEMFDYYCSSEALKARNETKHSRRCAALAYLIGDTAAPPEDRNAWKLTEQDFELPSRSDNPELYERLAYARAYFLHLLGLGQDVQSVYGPHRFRPVRVIDDLGRTLEFDYYRAPTSGGSRTPTFNFAGNPNAELLKEVRGPGGTGVRFAYGRPKTHPRELNEMFLVQVDRHDQAAAAADVVPAADRQFVFEYQWPGGPVPSHDEYAQEVEAKYLAYYSTFVGCWYRDAFKCPGTQKFGPARFSFGDPAALARREKNAYISAVADNIIRVFRNGVVNESETRYVVDPMSPAFDRATAQRYGSHLATQDPNLIPPDAPHDNWQTSLPKLVLAYQDAGPAIGGGDLTDSFLPAEIRERYPLEKAPPLDPIDQAAPVVGAPDAAHTGSGACDYFGMEVRRRELPGYRDTVKYYDAEESKGHPNQIGRLYRTRLSAEQLALAQTGDPTHNDLLSSLQPDTATPNDPKDHIARRIVGRRRIVAANANRICAWTRIIDRDGDRRFYGLNYRGQVLVDAVKERDSDHYLFTERLVNADGLTVQLRRPTRGAQPWSVLAGYTAYTYDEVDPDGNDGWNDWLPVFWSRRDNLLRVTRMSAGLGVIDEEESTGAFASSLGRYEALTYEPLFNQVKSIERGSIELRPSTEGLSLMPTDVPHIRLDYLFDYQELSSEAPASDPSSIRPVLADLEPWGFHWLRKADGTYDLEAIGDWQLPVKFFSTDVNGDGVLGFEYGDRPADRARGVPVVVVRSRPGTSTDPQVTRVAWAPHGRPSAVRGPDDSLTMLQYYSVDSALPGGPYGGDQPPVDEEVSRGFRGFLGRVRTKRFSGAYPPAYGPSEVPCSALAGPYQWLLPATVTSPGPELFALGLPQETVEAILGSVTEGQGRWLSTAFSYSLLGQTRWTWTDTGTTRVVRDTDGRQRSVTDPLGTKTEYTYTADGYPKWTVRDDASGNRLNEEFRDFDEDGRLTYKCRALSAGGCQPLGSAQPQDGVVDRNEYWPEGRLRVAIDPEGLRTEFRYDERGLLVHERATNPAFPGSWRANSYAHNADGYLEAVRQGDDTGQSSGLLTERFAYDGLGRLTTYTDVRGYPWQITYSNRDLMTRIKRDDVPYGAPPAMPTWETAFRYDDFERMVSRTDNGTVTAEYARTTAGTVYMFSAEGVGNSYTTYDLLGRPAWTRDSAGNQVVYTWRAQPHAASMASIRTDGMGARHTTATLSYLDPAGSPTSEVRYGSGIEQRMEWDRDGRGLVEEQRNPENAVTRYVRNFLGWPRQIYEQREADAAAPFDLSVFDYNGRGQLKEVVDPANQKTETTYDAFGAVEFRSIPGQPPVVSSFSYDPLGRVDIATIGTEKIKCEYDHRGDLIRESLLEQTTLRPLTEREYDDLGRVRRAKNFNWVLSRLLPAAERTVSQEVTYDSFGHLKTDSLQVGTATPHTVLSDWSISPLENTWLRSMTYTTNLGVTEWSEAFDSIGRLIDKGRRLPGGAVLTTHFRWLGDLYTGRAQGQANLPSPFRERRQIDALGLEAERRYTAIDVGPLQTPLHIAEGNAYCGGPWSTQECARPLLEVETLRDAMGRLTSSRWSFGHPRFSGGALQPYSPPAPWRGYLYTLRGQLDSVWEDADLGPGVTPAWPVSYQVTAADIAALGAGADQWAYEREAAVGGTEEIQNVSSGQVRWRMPVPRGPGHQLKRIEIDGVVRSVSYDAAGRVRMYGAFTYLYDPRGHLSMVLRDRQIVEAYAYDAAGRLVAVYTGSSPQPPTLSFSYDAGQIVAAFDQSNAVGWEAAWGPGLDQLIEWRDHAGGTGDHIPLVDQRNCVIGVWSVDQRRMIETADYDPEGRLLVRDANDNLVCQEQGSGSTCANPAGVPFGFLSAWRSRLTGLVYLRNRWYSPELGQFISHDPLGFIDSYNLYAYGGFDPINNLDPLGLKSKGMAGNKPTGSQVGQLGSPSSPNVDIHAFLRAQLSPLNVPREQGLSLGATTFDPARERADREEWQRQEEFFKRFPDATLESYKFYVSSKEQAAHDPVRWTAQFGTAKNMPGYREPMTTTTYVRGAPTYVPLSRARNMAEPPPTEIRNFQHPIEVGKKLEFLYGRATGSEHNIQRTNQMLELMNRIGIPDTPQNREGMTQHFREAFNAGGQFQDTGTLAEQMRTVHESILIGPTGTVIIQSVWEYNRLITFTLHEVTLPAPPPSQEHLHRFKP